MLFLGLLLTPSYRFPVATPVTYHAEMRFDGFLPILGIGQGKAEVGATFEVVGKTAKSAAVKLTAFEVKFNGEKIPLDLDDAQKYVPGGTFTYAPNGMVSAWDAPTVAAPIRVPGLDLKHLPEVVFLPIAFPAAGIEEGKSFSFSLPLSGGTADYTVTPGAATADTTTFALTFRERYRNFEDDANQVVQEKDAAASVATTVTGTGSGVFDTNLGRFTEFEMDDVATSKATDVQSKKVTNRTLTRHLQVKS
ncbi:MAG: hypothetical protein ACYC96_00630 [Fimbriimonadaceae bacterium]